MTAERTLTTTARRESKRFAKFLIVGAIGAIVDFGAFNFLYRVLGFQGDPWRGIAQTISFCLAVTSNFTWNRYWTYPESRSKPLARQFGQFFVLNLVAWLVRTPIFEILNDPLIDLVTASLGGPFGGLIRFATGTLNMTLDQLGNNVALGCAVIVVMLWNFFANRFITYSDVKIGH
jgi:putative flippase GtrA